MSVLGAIPPTYTQQSSSSRSFFIQKGNLNNYRLRPKILNEHVESSREAQAVVGFGNIVGQIFRASQDNINGIDLTMESAAGVVFDNFESYANSAALQVEWVETDPGDPATLEGALMSLPTDATVGDEWVRTIAATDYTDYSVTLSMYSNKDYNDVKVKFFVGDGTNTKSQFIILEKDSWESVNVNIADMVEDGGTTDVTQLTKIGFRLDDRQNGSVVFVDEVIFTPPPGSVSVELWDMGVEEPEDGITSIDDGTKYEELGDRGINSGSVSNSVSVNLIGGKRIYHVMAFIAGVALEIPGNTTLTPGNYYMIIIRYVDTDVVVYGGNTAFETNYYLHGYAFTSPDDSTGISKVGEYSDLAFSIYSTQDCYLNTLLKFYDGTPGANATEVVYIEDNNMCVVNVIAGENKPQATLFAEFKDRVFHFPKGGKFEVNQNDDYQDDTNQVTILIGYIFEPQPTYRRGDLT